MWGNLHTVRDTVKKGEKSFTQRASIRFLPHVTIVDRTWHMNP